ncbi:membrane protein [Allostella sp. ATCC 35155]|nr:membrane protein [Stella sp. ATCC 35155]
MTGTAPPGPLRVLATVLLPFAAGYFCSYLLRAVNAVVAPDLVAAVGLTAGDLGLLTAAYFLSFALLQVPLGVALDRWGPRRVQAILLAIAAAGILLFSQAESRTGLFVARAVIGFGMAGGLMASLKAITLWVPRERWPLVNGFFMATGGLGALAATAPAEAALQFVDWRSLFVALAALTAAAAALVVTLVPEKPAAAAPGRLADQFAAVGRIYRDPYFWRITPAAVTSLGITMAIQTLWAGPWLRDVGGLDREAAAGYLFAIAAALTAGFALSGVVTDLLLRRGVALTRVMGGALVLLILVQALITFQVAAPSLLLWVLFGLLSNGAIVFFPILNRHFPPELVARVNTATNLLNFGIGFAAQAAIGWIIDRWPAVDGRYPPEAYRWAFAAMLALQVLALLWFLVGAGVRRPARARRA